MANCTASGSRRSRPSRTVTAYPTTDGGPPVHNIFLSVTGHAQRNEVLNKTAVVRNKKGLLDGYTLDGRRHRLLTEGRIADTLTKRELDLIRWQLHALLNNDQAMNAAFRPFKTFGNDYTGTSEWFLSHHTCRTE